METSDQSTSQAPATGSLYWAMAGILLVLIAMGTGSQSGPRNWHDAISGKKTLKIAPEKLNVTYITPHLDASLGVGTNVLWCGTMQLAWNEACDLVGGELHFDQDHPMVMALNQRSFTKESIDAASYVAMAGFVKTNIHQSIRHAIQKKFGDSFKPGFVPGKNLTPRPQDFVAYACLYKHLAFPTAFERLDEDLNFDGVPVGAFGLATFKPVYTNLYPQVLILDYQNEDDFVIELKTKSEGDRLILAKVPAQQTLAETVAHVRARASGTNAEPATRDDLLLVPRMKFDLTRSFPEIEGRQLVATNASLATDLILLSAVQNTRFEMNEQGVELRSEAHAAFGCSKRNIPTPKHQMIFNKPFLIILERANARMPYFALWVDNAELLVRR
jgi:hypothetical protein